MVIMGLSSLPSSKAWALSPAGGPSMVRTDRTNTPTDMLTLPVVQLIVELVKHNSNLQSSAHWHDCRSFVEGRDTTVPALSKWSTDELEALQWALEQFPITSPTDRFRAITLSLHLYTEMSTRKFE